MDDARQSKGQLVIAMVARQFAPSRIERQLLAQVFDMVSRDPQNLKQVFTDGSEPHLAAAVRDRAEAVDDPRATSRRRTGGAAR
jgi:hypothetical protein